MLENSIVCQEQSGVREHRTELVPYPIDMSSWLIPLPVPMTGSQEAECSDPMRIAQYTLALWNRYCITHTESDRSAFLMKARWFVVHEVQIGDGFSSWPTTFPHAQVATRGSWLSALTQGCAVSLLTRAYQLTHEDIFRQVAARASNTFLQDILDGGVSSPMGSNGIFFEEVAVYPAAHSFDGFIYAIVGLYDSVAQTQDPQIEDLVRRALKTFRNSIDEFDADFWTYTDLVQRQLTLPAQLERQIHLLEILAKQTGDNCYETVATRWKGYHRRAGSRLRYYANNMLACSRRAFIKSVRTVLLPSSPAIPPIRACIPLNSLATGGILTVLRGVEQVTEDIWDIEYVTRYIELERQEHVIHVFGTAMMAPWQFPTVWVYIWDGFRKLISLMRQGAGYHLFLPQDGVFTAMCAGLASKLTGRRTVCVDHANLTLVDSDIYREERKRALLLKNWPRRLMSTALLMAYWPTLDCIARISARVVDHFLIPGVVGDGVEEICEGFGIPQSRLTRFNSMIDVGRHRVLGESEQAVEREKNNLPADAIVVAIICRLSPEKGLEIALESIRQSLSALEPEYRTRLRVVIAGDGPSRQSLEEEVRRLDLHETCVFWGDISADDVITLLAISHIFLYTSTRGACIPMAVLEAMASGCAVIATTQPLSNTVLLAQGRGRIVQPGNARETAVALTALVSNPTHCRSVGKDAREYVSVQHSPMMFRRLLQRVTFWSNLDDLLYG